MVLLNKTVKIHNVLYTIELKYIMHNNKGLQGAPIADLILV